MTTFNIFDVIDIFSVLLLFIDKKNMRTIYLGVPCLARNYLMTYHRNSIRTRFMSHDKQTLLYRDVFFRYFNRPEKIDLEYAWFYDDKPKKRFASMLVYMTVELDIVDEKTGDEFTIIYHMGNFKTISNGIIVDKYYIHQKRSNNDDIFKFYLLDKNTFEKFYSSPNDNNNYELTNLCKYYSKNHLSCEEECLMI